MDSDTANYFDTPSASPNLPEDDPLRQWAIDIQRDPELKGLMATDPQAAIERMKAMGIPPPPAQGPDLMKYTDGLDASNSVPPIPPYRSARSGTGVYGGAQPPPIVNTNPDGSIKGNVSDNDPGSSPYAPHNLLRSGAAAVADKARSLFSSSAPQYSGGGIGGEGARDALRTAPRTDVAAADDFEPNPNPVAPGGTPVPRPNPSRPTDVSSQNKPDAATAWSDFAKSMQGVKPVQPPAPNFVGTPSVRSPGSINAPALQGLLGLIGQGSPSPLGLTLGRLLASGKA